MKYEYKFSTETLGIEISEEWAEVLHNLDRVEYNNNHTETRRHCSLNTDMEDSTWLTCTNLNPDYMLEIQVIIGEKELKAQEIRNAINSLSESQKSLIYHIYIKKMKVKDYATLCHVDASAISHRIRTIKKNLKKYYNIL